MVLRQLLHGAHRGQPKTSRRPGVETLHGPVFATPALRATVDEPVEEIPGETPSSRIAFGDPDNTTFREIERTKKYVVLELVTGGFYAEPQGDRHRRPLSTVVLSANRYGRATKCRSSALGSMPSSERSDDQLLVGLGDVDEHTGEKL